MKKYKISLLVIFLFTTVVVQAQIDLGLKAGANFATLSEARDNGSKIGFIFGAFGSGKIGEKWALQGEILYSQQGSEFDAFDFDTEYINVPIIFKKYFDLGFNLQFGPQFGFLINDNANEFESIQAGFESKTFDLSGTIGFGYDFLFGIRLDTRYQFGFTDATGGGSYSGQNSVFTWTIGYTFL